jgi:hypothetical protein
VYDELVAQQYRARVFRASLLGRAQLLRRIVQVRRRGVPFGRPAMTPAELHDLAGRTVHDLAVELVRVEDAHVAARVAATTDPKES